MARSKDGCHTGKLRDAAKQEAPRAGEYYALEIEVPSIRESVECRMYFSSDGAEKVSRRFMAHLGVDATKPPLRQLKALIGKDVTVRLETQEYKGVERLNVVDIWLGERPKVRTIHEALGIDADEEDAAEPSGFDRDEEADDILSRISPK